MSFLRRRDGVRERVIREVAAGTTLLDAARSAGLPIARACRGEGLCGRCDLEIVEGADRLSAEADDERGTRARDQLPASRRLACRARVLGPVVATTGYW